MRRNLRSLQNEHIATQNRMTTNWPLNQMHYTLLRSNMNATSSELLNVNAILCNATLILSQCVFMSVSVWSVSVWLLKIWLFLT